ncbi:MAG: hypothetical protein HYY61_06690 [Deltaproteobacteria bacterium]|nr:hypothetical protein [Deltaproteobacteria bacterium]
MIALLLLIPFLLGLATFFIKRQWVSQTSLLITAFAHSALTLGSWLFPSLRTFNHWLYLDDIGLLFLSITSLLFLCCAIYGLQYLKHETRSPRKAAITISCLLFFLATMTLVILSQHLELLWVAIEATTLASAPLIYFHRSQHSLEATWKYLMIGSVGIALALLGNFFFAVSAIQPSGSEMHLSLFISALLEKASFLQVPWVHAAFIFYVVGYGTKMGLAPLHSWLPDAHSESPSFVSALLSGSLLNCAFLGILRAYQVCVATGQAAFAQNILLGFGMLSLVFATIFILKQRDYKRMLAYSSVEHMGILSLSVGLGGSALFGGMLHAINHSCTKAMLFLISGNILHVYKSKTSKDVLGVLQVLPFSGALWLIGFFAITGSPPFGTFISEFIILKSGFEQGHPFISVFMLLFLAMIFIGMISLFLKMSHGTPPEPLQKQKIEDPFWSFFPSIVLILIVIALGITLPSFINHHLHSIATLLGESP